MIYDAFQRQQVDLSVSPAEDGKSILIALPRPCVFRHRDGFPFFERTDNSHGGEIKERMPNAKVLELKSRQS